MIGPYWHRHLEQIRAMFGGEIEVRGTPRDGTLHPIVSSLRCEKTQGDNRLGNMLRSQSLIVNFKNSLKRLKTNNHGAEHFSNYFGRHSELRIHVPESMRWNMSKIVYVEDVWNGIFYFPKNNLKLAQKRDLQLFLGDKLIAKKKWCSK